jgi:hypothetical protein
MLISPPPYFFAKRITDSPGVGTIIDRSPEAAE